MGATFQSLTLVVNLIAARFFLVTLKQGNTPLITAIACLEQGGDLPPSLAAYTRRLTCAWGVFLICLGVSHLLFGWIFELTLHPALQFFIDPAALLLFFALEFVWRVHHFPTCHFVAPWKLWVLIRRNGGLLQLYRQCKT